jgi:hypothetical protein
VISNGGSTTFNLTFTSVNHFSTSSIQVFCGVVTGLTCTSSPLNATLADGGTATTQLTMGYTGPVTAAAERRHWASNGSQLLFCLIVLAVPWSFRRRHRQRILCIVASVALVFAISGCGGGGAGGGGGSGGGGGGSQTVSVSVTAQALIYSGNLQQNVGTISLTVQQ